MKKLLLAILLPSIGLARDASPHHFKIVPVNDSGKVYFEQIYNVYGRSDKEIIDFAIEYAKEKGYTVKPERIDTINHKFVMRGRWEWKTHEGFFFYKTVFKANIIFEAKEHKTRIYITDFTYKSETSVCKTQGTIEDIQDCEACHEWAFHTIEKWLVKQINEDFMPDYKEWLKKEVRTHPKPKW